MEITPIKAGEAYVHKDDGGFLGIVARGKKWNMGGTRSASRDVWFAVPVKHVRDWFDNTKGSDPATYARGWAHTRQEAAGLLLYFEAEWILKEEGHVFLQAFKRPVT